MIIPIYALLIPFFLFLFCVALVPNAEGNTGTCPRIGSLSASVAPADSRSNACSFFQLLSLGLNTFIAVAGVKPRQPAVNGALPYSGQFMMHPPRRSDESHCCCCCCSSVTLQLSCGGLD